MTQVTNSTYYAITQITSPKNRNKSNNGTGRINCNFKNKLMIAIKSNKKINEERKEQLASLCIFHCFDITRDPSFGVISGRRYRCSLGNQSRPFSFPMSA